MKRIEAAIEKEQWEVVALYLLLGVVRTLASLPPESADALIALLVEDSETETQTHRPRWRRDGSRRRHHD